MAGSRILEIAGALASSWRSRWLRAGSALQREPSHPDAWLWRLHLRIFGFLLKRYGDRAPLIVLPGLDRPDPLFAAEPSFGAPPRTREALRVILERIVAANRA